MRNLLKTITLVFVIFSNNVLAHANHGIISGQKAISIANISIKRLVFKNLGFEVGKLGESWKVIDNNEINVIDVYESHYIVSAKNTALNQTIYFKIGNDGQVIDVRNENIFDK